MDNRSLEADCAQCAALCCVAFAFERSDGFDMEKPPATPCTHLVGGHRCGIYPDRRAEGMAGCDHYTCYGAGQYVTQTMFDGKSWKNDPALLAPMVKSFLEMVRIQMTLATASLAEQRNLPGADAEAISQLIADLTPEDGWNLTELTGDSPVPTFERRLTSALSGVRKSYGA